MKKLLSAVTSLVMASTFVSSAFTSSLVVSAAGSVPAVQPNVSMDGVKDVTANKNASNADFVFDFNNPDSADGYWHAKAGESVDIDLHVTAAQNKKVSSFSFEVQAEGGITVSDILDSTPAFNTSVLRDISHGTCAGTCEGSDGHGINVTNGTAIMYTFDVPAGTPDGLYEINLTKAQLSAESNDVFYDTVEVQKGYIQVGEGAGSTSSTASTVSTASTNKPDTPVTGDFVFDFDNPDSDDGYWHANAGESVDVDMHVTAAQDKKVSSFSFEVEIAGGITVSDILDSTPAFSTSVLRDISHGTCAGTCEGSDGHGIIVTNGTAIMYTFDVPAGTPDGLYEINLTKAQLSAESNDVFYDSIGIKKGYIQVGDVKDTTTTTKSSTTTKSTTTTTVTSSSTTATSKQTTASTTVSTTATTTTVTIYTPADGNAAWVIPTVHAQRGEKVTLDVIVSGDSDLSVAGAQFKIDADSVFGKPNATGSNAYDSTLEYNADKNKYAFGQNVGKGIVAKNGDIVLSIDYTVPTDIEAGTYPVTWSDIFVSDTNGLEITDKVETVNGAIIIDETYDGEIAWDIPEVTAKPGETVTLDVIVKDTENAAIPVSGAQFKITADTAEFVSVSGQTEAYDAAIENNPKVNKFAFAQNIGKGTAAKDGDKVLTLTYTAPTDPGVYPVKWSETFISDTNGNELTQISFLDGSITVEADVADGAVTWDIGEETMESPSEDTTVQIPVVVKDSSASGLAVAGAQFAIKADSPIVYNSSTGSDAYDATVVENAKINAFAFAQGIGKGTAAKDGDNVLILTYTVPKDCPAGKYNINWSDAFVSDTNGNDITDKVKLVEGYIEIVAKSTTTTKASTTSASTTSKATTTSSQTTSATTTSSATTTTTVTAATGAIIWQIDEVEAEPGETVTVNMVVKDTNNTKLPVGGAQFVIKADSPIGYDSASGTPYGSELVGNDTNNKYAFANNEGKGVAANTGDIVISLKYTVPDDCADGRYPVTITDLFASDTNGLDITKNIMTIDGAITVKAKTTTTTTTTTQTTTTTSAPTTTTTTTSATVAPGNIMWVVDTVTAKPGDEVKVNVVVNDQKDAKLAIGGAQFIVDSADGIEYAGATGSEGYKAEAEVNGKKIAFAHDAGTAVAAADGSYVVTLTFKVPDDCEPGKYPVTLTDLFASDADGSLDITKNILVVDGAVIVEAKTTTTTTTQTTTTTTTTTTATTTTTVTAPTGAIIWQIDEVEAEAGETVTVNMVVKDTNNTKLPVGGVQFVIKADSPIVYNSASGTPYGSELVGNDTNNKYAFANSTGAGVAANTGDIVISLEYTVPDDCAAGRYPVTITDLFASDSNGLDITKNIMTIDGAIIVKAKSTTTTTTTTQSTTTTSAPTTTTTTTSASTTTTTTTSGSTTTTTTTSGSTTTTTTTSSSTTTTTTSGDIHGSDISNTTHTTTNGSVLPGTDSNTTTTTTTTTQTSTTTTTGSTTTTTLTYPHYYADLETEIGFYFSHDDGRRENGIVGEGGFSKEQVNISKMYRVDYDGATPEEVTFDPANITFNGATPATVYDKTNKTFKYEVPVFYNFGENGEEDIRPLLDADKNQVVITVYIGVKGDVNLDNLADAVDATQIQMYYAKLSAGSVDGTASTKNTQLSLSNPLVDGPDSVYDHFAAFLGDVNANEWAENNWKLRKEDRPELNAVDATQISMFYAYMSAHPDENTYDVWNMASPSRFGATD